MIAEIFRFELREQFRAPLFWVVAILFALLGFALMSSEVARLFDVLAIAMKLSDAEG